LVGAKIREKYFMGRIWHAAGIDTPTCDVTTSQSQTIMPRTSRPYNQGMAPWYPVRFPGSVSGGS
jgi:hypothetical protein